jgi:cytochrome c oxidase cbb3-type subunit 3
MNALKNLLAFTAAMLPLALLSQEATAKVVRPEPGQHFGLSDEVWLWLFMITAVVFTMIILTINSAIRNLAESKSLWKPKATSVLVLALLASQSVWGQAEATIEPRFILSDNAFWAMAGANVFLMLYALMQLRLLRNVTRKVAGLDSVEPVMTPLEEGPSWFSKFWMRINDLKAPEHESDLLLNHDYDGIQELDNNLPPWWKWTFYVTIIFGVVYLAHYHILKTGALPKEELALTLAQAEEEVAAFKARARMNVDETNVVFLLEEERLTAGGSVYKAYCAVCHGQQGEGGVGPNLTDPYWIHGGTIGDVFRTIKYGVPAKGMQAWNNNLTAIQIQNVSTYIMAMQGTNPPNAKDPQGEFAEPAVPEGAQTDTESSPEEPGDQEDATPATAQKNDAQELTVSLP